MITYLAELTVYDDVIGGTKVLRYASAPFTTTPSDTPANTHYDQRLDQPALLKRDLFDSGTTSGRSRMAVGDLVLLNGDGALDGLKDYGFDGRQLRILRGDNASAYSTFTEVFVGSMSRAEVGSFAVTVKLRDRQAELSVPLQVTKYAGSNALPDGLEGVETDLKGKPKPVCYGTVKGVSAVCVNTSKLIYQVNDGAVASIDAVYDRGIELMRGERWSVSTAGLGSVPFQAVAYNGSNLYVAVAQNGDAFYSADGQVWTAGPNIGGIVSFTPQAIAYGAGLFVVVGLGPSAGALYTSADGITWTSRTHNWGGSDYGLGVSFVNGVFLAPATGGKLSTSTNGTTWTARTTGTSNWLQCATYGGGLYVIAGWSGFLATSPDLATWTSRTSGFGIWQIYGLAYDGTNFVAVGAPNASVSSTATVAYSSAGTSWTMVSSGVTSTMHTIVSANSALLAGGDNGDMMVSLDSGLTWTKQVSAFQGSSPYPETVWCVLGGPNSNFVAVGGRTGPKIAFTNEPAKSYATLADLQDDSLQPSAGQVGVYLAGGYFRLGSSPAGLITADVTEGATSVDRTAGQIYKRILEDRAGYTSSDYSATDITALDLAQDAECGFWTANETQIASVLDKVAISVCAWWGPARTGVFRIQRFAAPSGTAVASYSADDMKRQLIPVSASDAGQGVPTYSTIVRYSQNYTVQTDLAGGVSDNRRAEVGTEWREATSTDSSVQTKHPLALQTVVETLLANEADAQDEADNRQTLYGADRSLYKFGVALDSTATGIDLGDVITLANPRFSLSSGADFRVLSLEPDAKAEVLTIGVWK